jgi:hypothetical protein
VRQLCKSIGSNLIARLHIRLFRLLPYPPKMAVCLSVHWSTAGLLVNAGFAAVVLEGALFFMKHSMFLRGIIPILTSVIVVNFNTAFIFHSIVVLSVRPSTATYVDECDFHVNTVYFSKNYFATTFIYKTTSPITM